MPTAKEIADKAGLVLGVDYELTQKEPFTDGITIDQYVFYLNGYNTPEQRNQRIAALMGKGGVLTHLVGGESTSKANSFTMGDFIPNSAPGGGASGGAAAGNQASNQFMSGETSGKPNDTGKPKMGFSVASVMSWAKANKGMAAFAAFAIVTILHRMFTGRWWWKKRRKKS